MRRHPTMLLAAILSFMGLAQARAEDYPTTTAHAAQACARPEQENASPYRVGGVICLRGRIDKAFSQTFFDLAPRKGDVVVASGPGGDAAAAMDIGDRIRRDDLLVVVDRICVSSCAYFIALGGERLALISDGMLGFHGGPIPAKTIMADPATTADQKAKLVAVGERFADFFKVRGVDIAITDTVPDAFKGKDIDWKTSMWARSAKELPDFGFHGVVYCSGPNCDLSAK